jgi:hypothetical protein
MSRTEPVTPDDDIYEFFMANLTDQTATPDDVEERCELCSNEAVVEGMLSVNGRWYDHSPLCFVCAINMERYDFQKEDIPDPRKQYETAVGNVMDHVDDEFAQAIIDRLGFDSTEHLSADAEAA